VSAATAAAAAAGPRKLPVAASVAAAGDLAAAGVRAPAEPARVPASRSRSCPLMPAKRATPSKVRRCYVPLQAGPHRQHTVCAKNPSPLSLLRCYCLTCEREKKSAVFCLICS